MGATSAEALIALGAPSNPNVRHSMQMHAKVFISDFGLVVGSANASASALGGDNQSAVNIEAGAFHPPSSSSWNAAVDCFERLFSEAGQVRDREIEWAQLIYRARPSVPRPRKLVSGSLLDLVGAAPWRFSKVGFVFTSVPNTKTQKDEVRTLIEESGKYDPREVDELDDGGTFYEWLTRDVKRWPEYFVEFWQPSKALHVYGRRRGPRIIKTGSFMSSRDWRGFRASCDIDLPSPKEINKADAEMALKLRGETGGILYADGAELAARVAEIAAEND